MARGQNYRDEIAGIRYATGLARQENQIRLKLGTRDVNGNLFVEYRSKAGKLGVYLLLKEMKLVDKYSGKDKDRCLLGFSNGQKMNDGKDGFWVDKEAVNFGPVEAQQNAPVPQQEPELQPGVSIHSSESWPRVLTPFDAPPQDTLQSPDLPF
jgi:hypothetical protein